MKQRTENRDQRTIKMFSVPISITSKNQVLAVVEKWVEENRQPAAVAKPVSTSGSARHNRLTIPASQPQLPHNFFPKLITTPNPEIIVSAQKDPEFLKALQSADLAVPDGIGVVWALRLLQPQRKKVKGKRQKGNHLLSSSLSRLSGLDLMESLIALAAQKGWRVMLVGGKPGIAQNAAEKIVNRQRWRSPYRQVAAPDTTDSRYQPRNRNRLTILPISGPQDIDKASPHERNELLNSINSFSPDLLFVAFGHGKQEKWLRANRHRLHAGVAIGVGGALDQIANPSLRPPSYINSIGLGWLYRLMRQPWRWRRQINLFRFINMVIKQRLTG